MDSIYETPASSCRFLDESYFRELHAGFLTAFSDYILPIDLTEEQFRNHIVLNAVDLDRSVGWFDDGHLIGFSLNGFGEWHGKATVYDAGTGVFPSHRRQGLSMRMFEMMLPIFEEKGYRQCLLEVITTNHKAIGLYEKLGFKVTRTLSLLECKGEMRLSKPSAASIELRRIGTPDWEKLTAFCEGEPSWQNTTAAIDRSIGRKGFFGAFREDECVGYIVFSANVGRISQIAVDKRFRGQGIGTRLLEALAADTKHDFPPQVINIDRSISNAMSFFTRVGFTEKVSQYEMLRVV